MEIYLKRISKKPSRTANNFDYIYIFSKKDGTKSEIKVTARNDKVAKQLTELVLDGVKTSKRRTKPRLINPAPTNLYLGAHISRICNCGVDYTTFGGNCAHYVCNRTLWKITNQDGIRYNCPSGFGINASDVRDYCANHQADWQSRANANAMTGQCLVFGVNGGRVIHVGIFDATNSVYHYGFRANRVLQENITLWENRYDSLVFYQRI